MLTGILIGAVCGFVGAYLVARNNMKYVEQMLTGKINNIVELIYAKVLETLRQK